jgi:hypothetical protein
MGSLCFAILRNTARAPAVPGGGIAAGQEPVPPPERSRPQRIAFTLRTVSVFPMTHHVECAAHLVKR